MRYKLSNVVPGVTRTDEKGVISFIPENQDNADWQIYQRWLAAGNTPEPADD